MKVRQGIMAVAVTAALGFAGQSTAALTKDEMKAEKDRIAADFKSGKEKCNVLKGNARDICMAEAKGAEKVAKADLEARDKGTTKAQENARMARAEADYDLAKEKCDDMSGNAKDVCRKDAKAAFTAAKADMKVEKTAGNANQKVAEARKDAAEDKRDANYAAAKERCDSMTGDVKDRCISDAKARFHVN